MARPRTTKAVAVKAQPEAPETPVPFAGPEALIARAIDRGVSIETMEKLLAMRRELKEEAAKEAYFGALASFQAACPEIGRDKQVNDKHGTPRYRYAPIERIVAAVKAALAHNGFSYVLASEQDEVSVTGLCVSHHIDGHTETTSFKVPIDKDAYMNEPQKFASARTFAQRYAFKGAYGIQTGDDDDDANQIELEGRADNEQSEPVRPPVRLSADKPKPMDGLTKVRPEVESARRRVIDHLHALVSEKIYTLKDAKEIEQKANRMSVLVPASAIAELAKLLASLPTLGISDPGLDAIADKGFDAAARDPSDEPPSTEDGELF